MTSLFDDLRHALRSLRTQPGFFLTAVLTMTLGIGAVTAIFSVYGAVLLNVVAVLASIALAACAIPTLHAARIPPMEALRDG